MKKKLLLILAAFFVVFTSSCEKKEEAPKESSQVQEESQTEASETNEESAQGKEVEETTGLEIVEKVKMDYAKSLKITKLADGYVYVEMLDGAENVLLVPKDKDFLDLDPEMRQVSYPVERIGAFSTTHVALLRAIDQLDKISCVNNKIDDWYIEEVPKLMEEGKIAFVGNRYEVDYELLQKENPDVILNSGSSNEKEEKLRAKLDDLGLTNIGISQHVENDPRGRIEWIKLFGILVNAEDKAEAYLADQYSRIDKIIEESKNITDKVTIANFRVRDDGFVVKRSDDYSVKMLDLAGGLYGFDGLVETGTGTYMITTEEFYKNAENVDVLIHENMGAFIDSIDKITQYGDFLEDLKAIKEGRIYTTKKNYWQEMDKTAEMIEEISLMLKDQAPDDMLFYQKIKWFRWQKK